MPRGGESKFMYNEHMVSEVLVDSAFAGTGSSYYVSCFCILQKSANQVRPE